MDNFLLRRFKMKKEKLELNQYDNFFFFFQLTKHFVEFIYRTIEILTSNELTLKHIVKSIILITINYQECGKQKIIHK